MTTLEIKTALDNQILALFFQGPKDKVWSEREIADGLGQNTVSICALERLQAAGKVKLTLDDNHTYLCQVDLGGSDFGGNVSKFIA
jgi:hypothetical protein